MEPKHTRSCVYQTAYHLVWRPVYRRHVLEEPVKSALATIFREIAAQYGMEILALSIATAVKLLKGISARRLRTLFPALRRQTCSDRLWAPSYYVGTAGRVSDATIQRYIDAQKGR